MKNKEYIAIGLVLAFLLSGCDNKTAAMSATYNQDRLSEFQLMNSLAIYDGVSVNNIKLSGLSRLEAVKLLKEKFEQSLDKSVTLKYKDKTFKYNLKDLGFFYNYDEATTSAFSKGRDKKSKEKVEGLKELKAHPINIELKMENNDEILNKKLVEISSSVGEDAQTEGFVYDAANDKVVPKVVGDGISLDIEKTKEQIKTSAKEKAEIELTTKNSKDNKEMNQKAARVNGVIGTATSYFNGGFWERAENIRISTATMNGLVINPGETFSFNGLIGDTTYDKGYQKSIVLMGTKEEPGMGGGVCQTSTCFYQAALKAGLEVVERHPHTVQMSYSDGGLDAAIENGLIDLQVRNPYDYPLLVKSYYDYGVITFEIYGDKNQKDFDYTIFSEWIGGSEHYTEKVYDESVGVGQEEHKIWGHDGAGYSAYRRNEKTGEVEYLGDTWYPAVNDVILVGPKPQAEETSSDSGN